MKKFFETNKAYMFLSDESKFVDTGQWKFIYSTRMKEEEKKRRKRIPGFRWKVWIREEAEMYGLHNSTISNRLGSPAWREIPKNRIESSPLRWSNDKRIVILKGVKSMANEKPIYDTKSKENSEERPWRSTTQLVIQFDALESEF